MDRWIFPGGPSPRNAPRGWRPSAPDDYEKRLQGRRIAIVVLLAAAGIGGIVGLVPLLSEDQEQARYTVTTIVVGLAAVGFALFVVARLNGDVSEQAPSGVDLAAEPSGPEAPPSAGREEEMWIVPRLTLSGVDLRKAALPKVDLAKTELTGALLEGADLSGAMLRDTRLADADLRKADLREADLRGADLRGADLWGASIDGAQVHGALYDEATVWPPSVDQPDDLGAVRSEEEQQ